MGASRGKLLPTTGGVGSARSHRSTSGTGSALSTRSARGSDDTGSPAALAVGAAAIYVYCVVQGNRQPAVDVRQARLPAAGPARVVPLGRRTWLVVADVPLAAYGAVPLERRLKDLEWVGSVGVAHQAMVDACMRHDAVVPMKVFTIFKTVARARDEMRRHAEGLRSAMRQVAGCVEWGVRVTRVPQPARDLERQATQPWAQAESGASGRAFLEGKLRRRNAVREEAAVLDQHVHSLADTLHDVTRDVRYRLDPTRGSVPVLLDAAYLVPRRSEKQFRAQVRAKSQPLLARGCRVTVTGPWPAYSFVSPDGR